MSGDGPSKAAPEAEPLDDIILGDDDATEILPAPPMRASQPPPLRPSARPPDRPSAPPPRKEDELNAANVAEKKKSSSNRMKAASSAPPEQGKDPKESQGRKRAKMTLRIPDDEISRPNLPATTPSGGIPALTASAIAASASSASSPPPRMDEPPPAATITTPSRPPSTPDDHQAMPLVRPLTGPPPAGFLGADDTLELPRGDDDIHARIAAATAALKNEPEETTSVDVAPPPPAIPPPAATAPLPPLNPPPKRQPSRPAFGVDASNEPGWTPFQPPVDAGAGAKPATDRDAMAPIAPTPIIDPHQQKQMSTLGSAFQPEPPTGPAARNGGGTILDPLEVANALPQTTTASDVPPVSEEIPVDMELPESDSAISIPSTSSDEVATHPRLPLDSEEIRIDEGDRISETGEVEVAPEDLVSVESLPAPGHAPPPLKTAGKYPAFKEGLLPEPQQPLVIQPAVQAAPAPQAQPQQPQQPAPAAAPSRPQVSSTPSSPPVAVATPQPTPAPPIVASPPAQMPPVTSTPPTQPQPQPQPQQPAQPVNGPSMAARRQSNPLIFVPPVGALAPPPMTDTAAHRKKTRPWWEELFNDDFIRTMAKVTDAQIGKEVNFIEESLGCEAGAMILDLACGTGRHAVELAARGYQVVGFDLSLAMLARASDEAQDRKQKINFVQGDMREMTFEETFDGVYSWNTSFGYFDEEKNGAVIARVHKSLKKGGQFLLDVVNRDYIIKQAPSLAWFEGDGCICMDEMTIDFITSRMKVKRTLMMDDGRTKEIEYSIRVYALHELGKMLHDNGFRVAEVSGRTGTPGVFFGCESPRTLILAEKR